MQKHEEVVKALAASLGPGLPLHRYSDYLMRRFGGKTYRVSVDAGFTCPVRETGDPCTYCDLRGSRSPYLGTSRDIREQVSGGLAFVTARYEPDKFLLYFQAFSNTHAPAEDLRRVYDAGLGCGEFAGLIVATRPDCLDEEKTRLLAEYRDRGLDVWVELGLQSAEDSTLERIHRGHTVEDFDRAARLLGERGILVAAHLILGLPGETGTEVRQTARHISDLGIDGVKFHNLVIVEGTEMYRQFLRGELRPPDNIQYRELLVGALEDLSPEVVVMRLTCDPPKDLASVPIGFPDKAAFFRDLVVEMTRRNTWQGRSLDNRARHAVP